MTITLGLTVFGWKLGALDMRMELDEAAAPVPVANRVVKDVSRWWTRRML